MTPGLYDAYYLPSGVADDSETTVQRFGPPHDAIELRLPVVTPASLRYWIEAISAARRERLSNRPAAEIHRVLEHVAQRFLDPKSPARENAVAWLARSGRFSAAMVERALDDSFRPLARGGVTRWANSELGSASALDRPTLDRKGVARRARGPEWMLQIYAGNVPGLPVWPFYSALAMKSALLAKTSSQEPLLAPLLARTIAEEDPDLGACVAVAWWKGGTDELDLAALSLAPAVLAFGGESAIASIARGARADADLVLHGPKVSVAYVAREALTRAALKGAASRAALDVALYDQQGCLSPHAFYVERGGEEGPAAFAAALGGALEELQGTMPRATPGNQAAARIQLYRAQARFDEATGTRGTRVLGASEGTDWTVVYEEGARFEPSPAYRTVRVHSVTGVEEVVATIGPAARYIEAVGLLARGTRGVSLASALAATGVARIAALGSLQTPSPTDTHGGVYRLLPFLRWATVEAGACAGAAVRAGAARAGVRRAKASASRSSKRGSRRSKRGKSRSH